MSSTVILPSSNNSEGPSTATPTPALPPPTPNVKSKRIFMYQGKQYLDPSEEGGETWSIEMVRNQLALIYPELTNATWQEIPQPDGSVLIEFVKVSGEKGQQTTFFSDDNTSPGQRVFVVEGKYFDDPGPMYTIQQIRDHFAQTYPHLSNATWESRHLADGREEITFVKVTGEKGSNPATIAELTQQLIKALRQVPPVALDAITLTQTLIEAEQTPEGVTLTQVIDLGPRLQRAINALDAFEAHQQRSLHACQRLQPMPSPRIPLGF